MQINFRDIDITSDYKFFSRVRRESSHYLDNAINFDDNEVKNFLICNHRNYKIVCLGDIQIGYLRLPILEVEGRLVQTVGLDLATEFRGRKLSMPIYKKLLNELEAAELPIVLWVLDFNLNAKHIYDSLGFKAINSSKFIQKGSGRVCKRIMMEYNHGSKK